MRTAITFNEEQVEFITNNYKNGMTVRELVEQFNDIYEMNISKSTMEKQLRNLKLTNAVKTTKPNKPSYTYEQMMDLILENKTDDEIANELGVGVRTVERFYVKNNIDWRAKKQYRDLKFIMSLGDVIDLRTFDEDSNNHMVSMVNSLLEKHGIEVIPNYELVVNGQTFIIDFYQPETKMGYIYNDNNRNNGNTEMTISTQVKVADILNKNTKEQRKIVGNSRVVLYEGLHLTPYLIPYVAEIGEYNDSQKATIIANEIIDQYDERGISHELPTDEDVAFFDHIYDEIELHEKICKYMVEKFGPNWGHFEDKPFHPTYIDCE